MLDRELRRAVEEVADRAPTRQAASVDALRLVQDHHRWVSDEHLQEVAAILGLQPAQLDAVASFYDLLFRRPVGEHVVYACDSVSCWLEGADEVRGALLEALGVELGQTSRDGGFTVVPRACLGACDAAPVLMIDEDTHLRVDPARIEELLAPYRNGSS